MKALKQLAIGAVLLPSLLSAQERFATRNGHIHFFSSTPVENIEADNRKVTSVFDATSGAIEFSALIRAFEFEKALMQEHFNENYMESSTHPKAGFKGKVEGITADDLKKPGTYPVEVSGDLTIHGVTKPVTTKGTMTVEAGGTIKAKSEFNVKPEDHGIAIPGVVRKNIAEQIKVTVDLSYTKM
ncbi:MAG: YceI family protein [Flavobacteriales bacterium]|nr:YceI family protein [Flavobacteriales bacterium]